MILLPRAWTVQRARRVVGWGAGLLVAAGLVAGVREACPGTGWGAALLLVSGVALGALLAVTAPGLSIGERALRLVVGAALVFPGTLVMLGIVSSVAAGCGR